MSFRKKIDMILKAKKLERLSINKIERELDVDGVIYKNHKADTYPTDSKLISDFIRIYRIRQQWWDKEWEIDGSVIFDEKVQEKEKSEWSTITEEQKLIATLERAVAILDKDNEKLWEQNKTLLSFIIEKLGINPPLTPADKG